MKLHLPLRLRLALLACFLCGAMSASPVYAGDGIENTTYWQGLYDKDLDPASEYEGAVWYYKITDDSGNPMEDAATGGIDFWSGNTGEPDDDDIAVLADVTSDGVVLEEKVKLINVFRVEYSDPNAVVGTLRVSTDTAFTLSGNQLEITKGLEIQKGTLCVKNTLNGGMSGDVPKATIAGGALLDIMGSGNVRISEMQLEDTASFSNAGVLESLMIDGGSGSNSAVMRVGSLSVGSLHNTGTLTVSQGSIGSLSGGGELVIDGVAGTAAGTLDIVTVEGAVKSLSNKGKLVVGGNLEILDSVSHGGQLEAVDLTVGDASFTSVKLIGALDAAYFSLSANSTVDGKVCVTGELSLGVDATLKAKGDVELGSLSSKGTLEVGGSLKVIGAPDGGIVSVVGDAELTDASFDKLTVTGGVTAGNLTMGDGSSVGRVSADTLTIATGAEVTVSSGAKLNELDNGGTLSVTAGNLSVNNEVKQGGIVSVGGDAELTDASFDKLTVTGEVIANRLSVSDGAVGTLNTSDLTVDGGVLAVNNSVSLAALSGNGTLKVGDKSVTLTSATGGASASVSAGELRLMAGAELADVTTDSIIFETVDVPLTLSGSISSLSGEEITVFVDDKSVSNWFVEQSITLISGISTKNFTLGAASWQTMLDSAYWRYELAIQDSDLVLNILTAIGPESGMVWNVGDETASNGYRIPVGEKEFYQSLDLAEQVFVTGEKTIDLTVPAVGDADRNATVADIGLQIRNLDGLGAGAVLVIKGDGAERDVATLLTDKEITNPVALVADAVKLNIGWTEGDDIPVERWADDAEPTLILESLTLKNAAEVEMYENAEILGTTSLGDGDVLQTNNATLTTGMLMGSEGATVEGNIVLRDSGSKYIGSYGDGATITASGDEQILLAGKGLSLVLSGGETQLLYGGTDAQMQSLITSSATTLVLDNAVESNGVILPNKLTIKGKNNSIKESTVNVVLGASNAPVTIIMGNVAVENSTINVALKGTVAALSPVDGATNRILAYFVQSGDVAENNRVVLTALDSDILRRYYTNPRLEEDGSIRVDLVTDYYTSAEEVSGNASAGLRLADGALAVVATTGSAVLSDLADTLDKAITAGNISETERVASAVAGASIPALNLALADDVERQLRAVRNRTTQNNLDVVNEEMGGRSYVWINFEGNSSELDRDANYAGYEMSSWGGSCGIGTDVSDFLSIGITLTAMSGDFTANAVDAADGSLDTRYLSAFVRYERNRWSHAFVVTLGTAEADYDRRIALGNASYTVSGNTDGTMAGFLYEVGYDVIPFTMEQNSRVQAITNVLVAHTELDAFAEKGCDASLGVKEMGMTTVTVGLGGRLQSVVGQNLVNRSALLEARALLKLRAADREAEADVALSAMPSFGGTVTSAELGAVGFEIGAGVSTSLTPQTTLYADASAEFSSGYTNVNGSVGIRVRF